MGTLARQNAVGQECPTYIYPYDNLRRGFHLVSLAHATEYGVSDAAKNHHTDLNRILT